MTSDCQLDPDQLHRTGSFSLSFPGGSLGTPLGLWWWSELYNSLGEVLREKGKIAAAKEKFKQAISLKPDDYEALNNLAFVFVAEKQLERAAELFQRKWRRLPRRRNGGRPPRRRKWGRQSPQRRGGPVPRLRRGKPGF
ncbi:MAG: tetratricopeptide repeat protein [Hormoscilla sp. GM102CHS1]|nr:tetratricopeptide repeat protein [Hormoscilla sp. GM102CHS1]